MLSYTPEPLRMLYVAYRTCYSKKSPIEIWEEAGENPPEKLQAFIVERLKTGHTSPLEQIVFWFGIEGLSRTASHQLVRHRIGISFEQQSQRYIRLDSKDPKKCLPLPRLGSKARFPRPTKPTCWNPLRCTKRRFRWGFLQRMRGLSCLKPSYPTSRYA